MELRVYCFVYELQFVMIYCLLGHKYSADIKKELYSGQC